MGFVSKIIIYFPRFFLSPTDDLFLTERTEFTDFLSLRDVFLPQILLIITNYNFFAHRLHRFLPNGIYISLIFSPTNCTNFTNILILFFVIICGICGQNYNLFPTIFFFISHRLHRFKRFFFFFDSLV